jgi:lysine decarboxylase
VRAARARLADVDGLVVLDGPGIDPLKLTLVLPGTGADGNEVEADLLAAGLPVEAAERDSLVAQVSLADTAATLTRLTDALAASLGRRRGEPRGVVTGAAYAVEPVTDLSPRAAFYAAAETVPAAAAVGRVSAELVAPYPPGIPVLAPGERVTVEVLAALGAALEAGVRVAYAADPTLATLRVVR